MALVVRSVVTDTQDPCLPFYHRNLIYARSNSTLYERKDHTGEQDQHRDSDGRALRIPVSHWQAP